MPFTPLTNYTGYNHVLFAGATFVHPGNGNIYFCACEQHDGVHQNLSVYRIVASGQIEHVKTYSGGAADSPSQITMGAAVISQGGAMFVATSLVIPDVPKVTNTGWQGSWIREPGIDAPWSLSGYDDTALRARCAALEVQNLQQQQQINALASSGGGGGGGLSPEDAALLDWVRAYRAVLHGA